MPKYNFVCSSCQTEQIKYLSIPEFLKLKKEKISCPNCSIGSLMQQISSMSSQIEKDQEQIIQEEKDSVRKIVEKVRSGDLRAIEDVYGDKLNPYKK